MRICIDEINALIVDQGTATRRANTLRKLIARELEKLSINALHNRCDPHATVFHARTLVTESEASRVQAEVVFENTARSGASSRSGNGHGVNRRSIRFRGRDGEGSTIASRREICIEADELVTDHLTSAATSRKSTGARFRISGHETGRVLKHPATVTFGASALALHAVGFECLALSTVQLGASDVHADGSKVVIIIVIGPPGAFAVFDGAGFAGSPLFTRTRVTGDDSAGVLVKV